MTKSTPEESFLQYGVVICANCGMSNGSAVTLMGNKFASITLHFIQSLCCVSCHLIPTLNPDSSKNTEPGTTSDEQEQEDEEQQDLDGP